MFFQAERREEMRSAAGRWRIRRIIAYMPTWRGKVIDVCAEEQTRQLQDMLDEIDEGLDEDTVFLCKLHRLNQQSCSWISAPSAIVRPFPQGVDTYDVLCAADVLVSDYSSVIIDFLCTGRRIVLFCYDHDEYVRKRGCYFDPAQLQLPMAQTVSALNALLQRESALS
ncbi:MAG: CDP-glycerol glycerophosphotransferase family protein [Merdibacter sp.]